MNVFKGMYRKKKTGAVPCPEELNRRAVRNITLIAAAGLVLMLADCIVSWSSGSIDTGFIPESGQVYLVRPEKGEAAVHMPVRASVTTEKGVYEEDLDLKLSPYRSGEDEVEDPGREAEDTVSPASEEEQITYQLRTIASGLDSDRANKKIVLPTKLPGGEEIRWSYRRQSHTAMILMMTVAFAVILYKSRLSPLKKLRQKEQDSVTDCLPVFIHQMVLLLNAGLVLDAAFQKTVENTRMNDSDPGFFYEKVRGIYDSIRNTNASLHRELHEFAKESGVREFLRISTVISDNVSRGTELTEKLERESEDLWMGRKLKCEERGRLAETKMTLPLTIFLGVLILITVAPALLEL